MTSKKRSRSGPTWLQFQSKPTPPPGYAEHQGEVAVGMANFFLRYLNRIYHEFDGDLALVIVLGEIAHHNISHLNIADKMAKVPEAPRAVPRSDWDQFQPCNAFSVSASTGIPRETVRRKIAQLVKRGWLRQSSNGEVVIIPAVADHFQSDFNIWLLVELLALARRLEATLARPVPVKKSAPPASKSSVSKHSKQ